MEIKSLVLGMVVMLLVVWTGGMVAELEHEEYRCFSVSSEKNLSSFSLQGLKAECHPDVPVRLCRITDIYQIGKKVSGGPYLVVAYNSSYVRGTMASVAWEGLEAAECPEGVGDLRESIPDTTNYSAGR